jgi:NitT/TauT family transport system substrate-binding protein
LEGVHEIPLSGDLSLFRNDPNMVQQGYSIFLPYRMTSAGIPNAQFKVADLGYRAYNTLFTTDEMLEKQPALVRKVMAAVKQGWIDFIRDPLPSRATIQKLSDLVPGDVHDRAVAEMVSVLLPHDPTKMGCMVPARWNETAEKLREVKFLPDDFDPGQAYDATMVPGC